MRLAFLKLVRGLHKLLVQEEAQDLVEYVLVVALLALGATASLKSLTAAISQEFVNLMSILSSAS
jgi:pilus assembly protein Flp/PilA